ncbi:MAG: phosphatidylglycerophosphatase A [Desulfatiglandales bacterium]
MKRSLIIFITSWFYVGRLPKMPGTWGTIATIPLYALMARLGPVPYGMVLLLSIAVSLPLVESASRYLNSKDPPSVVLDEVIGFLVTMFCIPFGIIEVLLGFFLFRLFDILKPYPIKGLERIRGGILWDDLVAGVYANILMRIIILLAK